MRLSGGIVTDAQLNGGAQQAGGKWFDASSPATWATAFWAIAVVLLFIA